MRNTTHDALISLGLSDKEAKIYLALLEMGRGSAYAIAEKSGLKKPTTYVILGELILKGFVFRIPRVKKQLFMAKDPDAVFSLAEEKLRSAKSSLPELRALATHLSSNVKTIYFEGIKGIEEASAYKQKEMAGKEYLGFYAKIDKHTPQEFIDFSYRWSKALFENGTTMRGLAPDDVSLKRYRAEDQQLGRRFKNIPVEEYSSTSSIDVGETFVRIFMNNQLQAVIIENPDLAKTMREIFEMLWKRLN